VKVIPLSQLANAIGGDMDQFMRAVKISLMNGVIRDTRVDTGRLKGNWQTTTGSEATGTVDRFDPGGGMAQADVRATVQGDTVDYLTNNLPYAEVWEERDGMVARNVARLDRILREESLD
jgi:hypothetical protein